MYDEDTTIGKRPDDLRRHASEPAMGGTLTAVAQTRDVVDRLEVTIERLIDKLAPVLSPPSPMTSGEQGSKSSDDHSDLTVQINGIGQRVDNAIGRLNYTIERIDL